MTAKLYHLQELLLDISNPEHEVTAVSRYIGHRLSSDVASYPGTEPTYNDIGLCDISPISSDILWYQLIPYH